MNFHKTIGFLAALLLMLGLGVPDSFAQNTVTINSITLSDGTTVSPYGGFDRGWYGPGRDCVCNDKSCPLPQVQL